MPADERRQPSGDPVAAARKNARRDMPRRFYKSAEIVDKDGLLCLYLDGRQALSPGRKKLAVQDPALAEALCSEWQAQGKFIDVAAMPVTRLLNTALDAVAGAEPAIRADILGHAGADLLCYRASEPQGLVDRQRALWDPVLAWAEKFLDARFNLGQGVVYVEQPPRTLKAMKRRLAAHTDPVALAGLALATKLTGSALLSLAVAEAFLPPEEAWRAAHVDEDWNISQWGEDADAAARRQNLHRDFMAAALALGR